LNNSDESLHFCKLWELLKVLNFFLKYDSSRDLIELFKAYLAQMVFGRGIMVYQFQIVCKSDRIKLHQYQDAGELLIFSIIRIFVDIMLFTVPVKFNIIVSKML